MAEITIGNNVLSNAELEIIHRGLDVIDHSPMDLTTRRYVLDVIRSLIPHLDGHQPVGSPAEVIDKLLEALTELDASPTTK